MNYLDLVFIKTNILYHLCSFEWMKKRNKQFRRLKLIHTCVLLCWGTAEGPHFSMMIASGRWKRAAILLAEAGMSRLNNSWLSWDCINAIFKFWPVNKSVKMMVIIMETLSFNTFVSSMNPISCKNWKQNTLIQLIYLSSFEAGITIDY